VGEGWARVFLKDEDESESCFEHLPSLGIKWKLNMKDAVCYSNLIQNDSNFIVPATV
jgi:hypothetical protein